MPIFLSFFVRIELLLDADPFIARHPAENLYLLTLDKKAFYDFVIMLIILLVSLYL